VCPEGLVFGTVIIFKLGYRRDTEESVISLAGHLTVDAIKNHAMELGITLLAEGVAVCVLGHSWVERLLAVFPDMGQPALQGLPGVLESLLRVVESIPLTRRIVGSDDDHFRFEFGKPAFDVDLPRCRVAQEEQFRQGHASSCEVVDNNYSMLIGKISVEPGSSRGSHGNVVSVLESLGCKRLAASSVSIQDNHNRGLGSWFDQVVAVGLIGLEELDNATEELRLGGGEVQGLCAIIKPAFDGQYVVSFALVGSLMLGWQYSHLEKKIAVIGMSLIGILAIIRGLLWAASSNLQMGEVTRGTKHLSDMLQSGSSRGCEAVKSDIALSMLRARFCLFDLEYMIGDPMWSSTRTKTLEVQYVRSGGIVPSVTPGKTSVY